MRWLWIVASLVLIGTIAYALRPVCVPLADEALRQFNVPIAERIDRDLYLKVFQQRDGQWFQCKTSLSRRFFF